MTMSDTLRHCENENGFENLEVVINTAIYTDFSYHYMCTVQWHEDGSELETAIMNDTAL
jgi:hypothetical protein